MGVHAKVFSPCSMRHPRGEAPHAWIVATTSQQPPRAKPQENNGTRGRTTRCHEAKREPQCDANKFRVKRPISLPTPKTHQCGSVAVSVGASPRTVPGRGPSFDAPASSNASDEMKGWLCARLSDRERSHPGPKWPANRMQSVGQIVRPTLKPLPRSVDPDVVTGASASTPHKQHRSIHSACGLCEKLCGDGRCKVAQHPSCAAPKCI